VTQPDLSTRVDDALATFLHRAGREVAEIATDLEPLAEHAVKFGLSPGKRLRPAFAYWGYRAAGSDDDETIIRAAAALELLHAAALVHDDVIDASDLRRGAPSTHRTLAALHESSGWTGDADAFGRSAAILLGDLLLVWADAMLTRSGFDSEALARALPVWDAVRVEVMCGQYLDVAEQARGGGSVERSLRVAQLKTSKYTVERPLHLGAGLGAGSTEVFDTLSAYGAPLGEAFQLRDDVLGVYGDPAQTGKPAGDDLREGKRTVLVALATDRADRATAELLRTGIGDRTLDDAGVERIRVAIATTGALERVEAMIAERVAAAISATEPVAEPARSALLDLARAASDRVS
jgi:geranylgeranyl diphosphate synthase type I